MQTTEKLVSKDFLLQHLPKEVLIDYDLCPDCLQPLIITPDGAKICKTCAGEWDGNTTEEDRIPLPQSEQGQQEGFESHWQPGNELAFNRGMGVNQWISGKAFCRIISRKDPKFNEDLGIRARQLKILTSVNEHPKIQRLLALGSELCKNFNMDTNKNEHIIFSNMLGRELRKIGAYLIVKGDRPDVNLPPTAKAVFVILLRKYFPEKFQDAVKRLKIDADDVGYVYSLLEGLQLPKKGAH